MQVDVRDSSVIWLVFRRADQGKGRAALYHYQGCGVATGTLTAEEMAVRLCRDETYLIFPSPVNVALPEKIISAPGLYFPKKKDPKLDLRTGQRRKGDTGRLAKC